MFSRLLNKLRRLENSGPEQLPEEVLENIQKTLALMNQMVDDAIEKNK